MSASEIENAIAEQRADEPDSDDAMIAAAIQEHVVAPVVAERDTLKAEAAHFVAQRLALDEVAGHADRLRADRDVLLWLRTEAVWQRNTLLYLVQSWCPAAVEATPAIALMREGIERSQADATPSPSDRQVPPSLGGTGFAGVQYGAHVGEIDAPPDGSDRTDAEPPALAETRTGTDWCPNCCIEVGTNRYRDDGGTERCATCGSELETGPASPAAHIEPCGDPACQCAIVADFPAEAFGDSAGVVPTPKASPKADREVLLDALLTADDDYRSGYRTTAYLTHLADRLLARYDIRERGEAQPAEQQDGAAQIAAERRRQVEVEGWTAEHDDDVGRNGELAFAATVYAMPLPHRDPLFVSQYWPWEDRFFKPTPDDRIRELVKAGALIAAEINRLQRAERGETA